MSIRDRLNLAAWALFGGKGISGLDMLLGADAQAWYPSTDFNRLSAEGYEYNSIVYSCITALMDAMEEAPLLVEVVNRKGEWEEKPDHRLARLLQRPNPEMGEDDLQSVTTLYQKLAGNAFWEKERSKAGSVVGLWAMRPDRVGIVAATSAPRQRVKQRILNYTWRSNAEVVTLPGKDVIHFKERHPRDDLFGMPPLAAGARDVDIDNRATNYVGSFFDNAAVPKGLLTVKKRIDDAEEKRIRKRLKEMYTGRLGWHEPMILGEGSEWKELSETFKDMDFPNLRKITETRICAIFKVPPIVAQTYAGLERGTYDNYDQAWSSFIQGTVVRMYKRFDSVLNRSLAWEFGEGVRVRSDISGIAALSEDMDEVWARVNQAVSAGWITVNDARLEVGLDPVAEGDVFLRPLMLQGIPAQPAGQKVLLPIGREIKALPEPSEDALEREWKAFDLVARAWEARFRAEAREQFKRELAELLAILRREGKRSIEGKSFESFLAQVVAFLIDSRSVWAEGFLSLFTGLMGSQAEEVLGALGFSFDIESPEVQQFLQTYTMRFAGEVSEFTERSVRELVAQAQAEGWSVPHLREEIMSRYDEFDQNRADAIARTETIRSSNAGSHEAYRLAGITRTQWYCNIDGRQCPFCEWMHSHYGPGTEGLSIEENYVSLGDELSVPTEGGRKTIKITYTDVAYPPLHTKCRCRVLAVVE